MLGDTFVYYKMRVIRELLQRSIKVHILRFELFFVGRGEARWAKESSTGLLLLKIISCILDVESY